MPPDEQPALYIDLLGFEALIEAHPQAIESESTEDGWKASGTSESSHQYNKFFSRLLEGRMHTEGFNGHFRAMLFSDCAFLVLGTPLRTALLAADLMRECLLEHVPVRMGIGVGSFNAIRSTTDEFDGVVVTRAMFTGTAITRAARIADTPNHKGMRIFIHPKTSSAALDNIRCRVKVLPLEPVSVGWELDYLNEQTPAGASPSAEDLDIKLFQSVVAMREPGMSAAVLRHYTETFEALNVMRRLNGRKAFRLPESLVR